MRRERERGWRGKTGIKDRVETVMEGHCNERGEWYKSKIERERESETERAVQKHKTMKKIDERKRERGQLRVERGEKEEYEQ